MRICLYETSHHETALAMLLLLDPGRAELTVFTTETVEAQLRAGLGHRMASIRWIICGRQESPRSFIKRMGEFCRANGPDVLLLETVEANHYPIAREISGLHHTRVLLTIHDVHNNFLSRMRPSLRGIVRHFGKKMLLSRVNGFIALSSKVAGHLANFIKDGRPVTWVPGAVFMPADFRSVTLQHGESIRMVVPGSYDMRRRDYDKVFRLAAEWEAQGMAIHIILLGGPGPDTEKILARSRNWTGKHVHLTSFGNVEVPEHEFTSQMGSAHFIWVPSVVRTTIADGIEEIYGLSKSSGNVFDAIRYARPLIVPAELLIDAEQEPACTRYGLDDALTSFLRNLSAAPATYAVLLQHAHEVAEQYTVEKIRARTPELGQLFRTA